MSDLVQKDYPLGGFFTRNPTEDPRYPEGSYYESMGWKGFGHTTNIYDSNGNLIDQHNPTGVNDAARTILGNKLRWP